ncbi:MAG: transcriptional regulator NrdR [Pseudomonadota bacterium]
MKCPFCEKTRNKVIDSRLSKDRGVIRRRRECLGCRKRFTTYERVEEIMPMVVKKDGRREPFSRQKILEGMKKACQKRNISINDLESFVDQLERSFQESGEKEIPSDTVGERVMARLHEIDDVAFVRFASVYRSFKDVNDFMKELKELLVKRGQPPEVPE